jgi:hypothetical protein
VLLSLRYPHLAATDFQTGGCVMADITSHCPLGGPEKPKHARLDWEEVRIAIGDPAFARFLAYLKSKDVDVRDLIYQRAAR